jgi:hypothetical protein
MNVEVVKNPQLRFESFAWALPGGDPSAPLRYAAA